MASAEPKLTEKLTEAYGETNGSLQKETERKLTEIKTTYKE